jgi:glyoxylase-like metal-dependent hydrolase (beta-lactamase superfamily II)
MMVGHLLVRDTGVVFIDPPLIPGLIDAAAELGKPEAILLTTQNHTRATAFMRKRAGIPAYLPEQDPNSLDPREAAKVKDIGDFQTYKAGGILGFQAIKFGSEHILLTDEKELLVGDMATGDTKGNLVLWPDWYTPGPPYEFYSKELKDSDKQEIRESFKALVKKTGATSLFASHGHDIIGNLQVRATEL